MTRTLRPFPLALLIVVTVLAWAQPQPAQAWCGRWRSGFWGVGIRPWCGPVIGPRFGYGWGGCGWGGWYGGPRFAAYDSVYLGGPYGGFFSGGVRSYVAFPGGWAPWRPVWGGCYGLPQTYYPYPLGFGCTTYAPIVVSPFGGSIAPVYGPAGVLPYMFPGVAANTGPTLATAPLTAVAASRPASMPAGGVGGRADQQPLPPEPQLFGRDVAGPAIAVRPSNGVARLRAARLVAIGDRHLRTAVQERAKLAAALDAYRRAATIAADQPDTFLRQAIVLAALERPEDAARAVDRAAAIDARLGPAVPAAVAAREQARLPPDPVFGDRAGNDALAGGPTTLASRSSDLLSRIFRDEAAGPARAGGMADANWIAERWSRRFLGRPELVAAR